VHTTAVVLKVVDGDTVDIRDDIRGASTGSAPGHRYTRDQEAALYGRRALRARSRHSINLLTRG
jgi:hypothetical protein